MATVKKDYDASDVQHLTNRDAVREKPSMYLGELGEACAFTVAREVLDNVVDEALNGFASACFFYADEDGSYWVWDDGRGMPVGTMQIDDGIGGKRAMSAFQAITGLLHAGAKLSKEGSAYAVSRGSHGIGIKGTNFTARYFEVWTKPKEGWHYIGYTDGRLTTSVKKCEAPEYPNKQGRLDKGTLVHFLPDKKIIRADKFAPRYLAEWATVAAYFTPNFKITAEIANGPKRTWHFPDGPKQYLADKLAKLEAEPLMKDAQFVFQNELVACAIVFTSHSECEMQAFTNGLKQVDKGVHFSAVFAALQAAIEPHIKARQKFSVTDLKDGIIGLINVKLSAPEFGGQTKEKLVDSRADKPLRDMLTKELEAFFKKNPGLATKICERAQALANLRSKFTASKELLREVKARGKNLPAKAQTAPHCRPEERELFLLEGDSAAGTARSARDPHFQECLPLKGKIMNAMRAKKLEDVLTSEEVLNILVMLGFDPRHEDPMEKLRVGKIVFLADPDPDGPLMGDTKLWVRESNSWSETTLLDLYNEPLLEGIDCIAWDHQKRKFVLSPIDKVVLAHADAGAEEVVIRWDDGTRVTCSPNHKWVVHTPRFISKDMKECNASGFMPDEADLQFIRANDLKAGYKVLAISPSKLPTGHPQELLDASRSLGVQARSVASVKVRKVGTAHDKYCLVIPRHHNFVLSNGVVSGNCHINSLLGALLWKLLPGLFADEKVYVAELPEFYAKVGKEAIFAHSARDLRKKLEQAGASASTVLHHVKGYGELPPQLLAKIAFDPATRSLRKLTIDSESTGENFTKLMSDDPEIRQQLMGI